MTNHLRDPIQKYEYQIKEKISLNDTDCFVRKCSNIFPYDPYKDSNHEYQSSIYSDNFLDNNNVFLSTPNMRIGMNSWLYFNYCNIYQNYFLNFNTKYRNRINIENSRFNKINNNFTESLYFQQGSPNKSINWNTLRTEYANSNFAYWPHFSNSKRSYSEYILSTQKNLSAMEKSFKPTQKDNKKHKSIIYENNKQIQTKLISKKTFKKSENFGDNLSYLNLVNNSFDCSKRNSINKKYIYSSSGKTEIFSENSFECKTATNIYVESKNKHKEQLCYVNMLILQPFILVFSFSIVEGICVIISTILCSCSASFSY